MASSRPQDTHGRAAPGSAGRATDSARGQRESGAGARDRAARERAAATQSRSAAPSRYDSRTRNPRYSQNLVASAPMTAANMMELSKMVPGPGMAMRAALGMLGSSLGPQFEGSVPRSATGFSYDAPNRISALQAPPTAASTVAKQLLAPRLPATSPAPFLMQSILPRYAPGSTQSIYGGA